MNFFLMCFPVWAFDVKISFPNEEINGDKFSVKWNVDIEGKPVSGQLVLGKSQDCKTVYLVKAAHPDGRGLLSGLVFLNGNRKKLLLLDFDLASKKLCKQYFNLDSLITFFSHPYDGVPEFYRQCQGYNQLMTFVDSQNQLRESLSGSDSSIDSFPGESDDSSSGFGEDPDALTEEYDSHYLDIMAIQIRINKVFNNAVALVLGRHFFRT